MTAITSVNPATLEINAEIPSASADDVARAVAAARVAQRAWGKRSYRERLAVLQAFARGVLAKKREIAETITREMGKPIPEALAADVLPVLDAVDFLAREGEAVLAPRARRLSNPLLWDRTSRIVHEPRGVIGIVSPWNYPFGIPGTQVAQALFAGNGVVLKPASATTLTALKLKTLFDEAGLPKHLLAVVPGPGSSTGQALIGSDIDYLIFTGSVPVGHAVEARSRGRGVPTCMELGGSDPAIVLADAELDVAANGIVWGRFTNAGQTCAAVKRVFVEKHVAEELTRLIVEKTKRLKVGDGLEPGTDVGPLAQAKDVKDMEGFVADAVTRGARVLLGGRRPSGQKGHFFEPTVLSNVPAEARVLREEVFGPVLPIVPVADADEAVARANDSRFGLTASVWTRDRERAEALARRLHAGTVTINDAVYTFAATETPWGGVKDSGHGRTHGGWGLRELTIMKHVNFSPPKRPLGQLWWFPYGADGAQTLERGLDFLYGGAGGKLREGAGMARRLLRKRNL